MQNCDSLICRVCGNQQSNRPFVVREMQFGTREPFTYFQCARCECVQIVQVPDALQRYYPREYYSFAGRWDRPTSHSLGLFFRFARLGAPVLRWLLFRQAWPFRVFRDLLAATDMRLLILNVMSHTGVNKQSSILDVGSGSGFIAYCLKQIGFAGIVGIDPFLAEDLHYKNGLSVLKSDLQDLPSRRSAKYDLIMFHHSLEHMECQADALRRAANLLREEGIILVRMPVMDCEAFARYRENLVSLDAPRHLVLHTRQSVELLAEQAGLGVDRVLYDSNESQFWASEQYQCDIPLESPHSYRRCRKGSMFSRGQLREFRRMAIKLNREGRGDCAAFILKKTR